MPSCTPEGYYTAPAAPDWRGEIRVGRKRTLTQRSTKNSDCESSPCQSPSGFHDPRMATDSAQWTCLDAPTWGLRMPVAAAQPPPSPSSPPPPAPPPPVVGYLIILSPPKRYDVHFRPPPLADQKVTIIGEPFRRKPGKHPRRHGARQSRDVRRGCGRGSGEAARAARSGGQRQGQLRRRILQKDPLIAVSAKPFALPLKGLLEVPKPQSVSSESAAPVSSRPATVDP